MAHDVFISYSTKDKAIADAACALLESLGVRCWIAPRDVLPGSDWSEAIVDAIAASRVMVLIFSANANASPQVRREVEQAVNKEVTIVPFRIENVRPSKSLEYFISVPHWMDAYLGPLETYLRRLADRVSTLLHPPTEPQPSPAPVYRPAGARPRVNDASARPRNSGRTGRSGTGGTLAWFGGVGAVGLLAAVVGAAAFSDRFPWPRPERAAAAGAETSGVRPAPPTSLALLGSPALPPRQSADPGPPTAGPVVTAVAATREPRERGAGGAEPLQERRSAADEARAMKLTTVAVVGRERMCVIDGKPLWEGEWLRGFAVSEIRTDRVVLSRDGESFYLRPPAKAAGPDGGANGADRDETAWGGVTPPDEPRPPVGGPFRSGGFEGGSPPGDESMFSHGPSGPGGGPGGGSGGGMGSGPGSGPGTAPPRPNRGAGPGR